MPPLEPLQHASANIETQLSKLFVIGKIMHAIPIKDDSLPTQHQPVFQLLFGRTLWINVIHAM